MGERIELLQVRGLSVAQRRPWTGIQAVDLSTIRHLAPRASAWKRLSFEKIDPHSILLVSPWSMPVFSAVGLGESFFTTIGSLLLHQVVSPLRGAKLTFHARAAHHPATEDRR